MSPTDFTRNRKLTFKNLIFNLLGFTRPGVQVELDRFFKSLTQSGTQFSSVSKSAFTQARVKLKHEVFIKLNENQLDYFNKKAINRQSWNENRVIAIDGSLLNLPHTEEVEKEFGGVTNQHEKVISARCSFAFDVCNQLVIDAQIAPRRSCEKELAKEHLKKLNSSTDILVFDRGYPCQWLVGLLVKKRFKFCFRLSSAWKKAYKDLEEQGDDINWTMVHNTHKKSLNMKIFKIPNEIEGVRLVEITLSSGEKEVLLTNLLDQGKYDKNVLKELYFLRWGVEESFKAFKKTLNVEFFTGKTSHAIKQDFHAKVFLLNLSSLVSSQGLSIRKGIKHTSKPSRTQVIAKLKDFLIDLFYKNKMTDNIHQMIQVLESRYEILRLNRSFPRVSTSSRRRHKIMTSKGI